MKKTLTINLAGIVYHIDEDAYLQLKAFLDTLEREFKKEPDIKEIITDIEARIAELLNERLGNKRQVIINGDIDYIIETMGDPEVIFDDNTIYDFSSHSKGHQRRYRRMYRDPDNRVIGGVCSGLAAYWDIDPTIIRVVFVVLVLVGGSGLFIYLILLIVLPEAQTTAQKLEMKGEAVNIDSIRNFFSEEFENVKRNFKKK